MRFRTVVPAMGAVLLLGISLSLYLQYDHAQAVAVEQFQDRELRLARQIAGAIEHAFDDIVADASRLSMSGALGGDVGRVEGVLRDFRVAHQSVEMVAVVDARGRVIARDGAGGSGTIDWPQLRQVAGGRKMAVSQVKDVSPGSARYRQHLVVAVKPRGAYAGAVCIMVNPYRIWQERLRPDNRILRGSIVDAEGRIVLHPSPGLTWRRWQDLADAADLGQPERQVLRRLQVGQVGVADVSCRLLGDGPSLLAYAPFRLGSHPLSLVLVSNRDEATAAVRGQAWFVGLVMIGVVLLFGLGGYAAFRAGRTESRLARQRRSAADLRAARRSLAESEGRLRAILRGVGDGVIAANTRGIVTFINPTAQQLTGWGDGALGKKFAEVFNVVDSHSGQPIQDPVRTVLHEGTVFGAGAALELRSMDGTNYRVSHNAAPIRNVNGRVGGVVVTFRDVTADVRRADALAESEDRYRRLFTSIGEGFALHEIICDADDRPKDYRFIEVNPAFERMTGLSRDRVIGKTVLEVLPGTERYWIDTYGHVALAGESTEFEHYSAEMGKHFQVLAFSPRRGFFAVLFLDITDRVRSQEALLNERNLLRSLMDSVPDKIYFKDRQSRFTRINRALANLFHLDDPTEAVGKTDADFFTTEHARQAKADEDYVMATGLPLIGKEEKETWTDGHVTWVSTTKVPLRDASGEVTGTFGISRDITQRKRTEQAIRDSEARFRTLFDGMLEGFAYSEVVTDSRGRAVDFIIRDVNPGFEQATGLKRVDIVGRRATELKPPIFDGPFDWIGALCSAAMDDREVRFERHIEAIGRTISVAAFRADEGFFGAIFDDVTERRSIEEQFRQAQKMEAVGQLAGGIAHDFNNQLTVVKGYCDLLLQTLQDHDEAMDSICEIRSAAQRAATLTDRLLAFSRKQVLRPEAVDLSGLLTDMIDPLRKILSEDIRVSLVSAPSVWPVLADPIQVQQAIMNIALNARDAMPEGGTLTLETMNVTLDGSSDDFADDLPAGRYVALVISDSGTGMDESTLEKIFDPFFTTKPVGQGTGLGLAMVYGFVKQSGGAVSVGSQPGVGTIFRILLPCAADEAPVAEAEPAEPQQVDAPLGSETIMVVEDHEPVRQLVVRVLQQCGYDVLASSHPMEAVSLSADHDGTIDLLVADVVMPGLSGPDLADKLKTRRGDLRVLFMSGYAGDSVHRGGRVDDQAHFLRKPFTPANLARTVRDVLDAP